MELMITGTGAITSVGMTASAMCAALRAGLPMPSPITYHTVRDEETQEAVGISGHPVRGYTEGFVGLGRALRLSIGAVRSLLQEGSVPGAEDARFWQRTILFLVGARLDSNRWVELNDEDDLAALKVGHLGALLRAIELPIPTPPMNHYFESGAVGLAGAIALAEHALSRSADRALIVAADSYLDVASLEWLEASDRVKTAKDPVGLMPGEAGLCLLLERKPAAEQRGAKATAAIVAAAHTSGPNHVFGEAPPTGAFLARAIRSALLASGPPPAFAGDIVCDHNGESWRAQQWGLTQASLAPVLANKPRMVWPAMTLGDVGAASSMVGVAVAAQSFARGYASGPRTLVVSSSEYGEVGAIVVRAEK